MKTLSRFYDLIKSHIKQVIIIIVLTITCNILAALGPVIIRTIIDLFMQNKVYEYSYSFFGKEIIINVLYVGILYIAIMILENIIDYIAIKLTAIVGENILDELRKKLFKYSLKTNMSFHDKTPAGKLYARITNDTEEIGNFIQNTLITLFTDFSYEIVILIIMATVNWKFTLISFPIVLICLKIISSIIKKANKKYEKGKIIRTKLNTFLSEIIYGSRTIKIFNIQDLMEEKEENITRGLYRRKTKNAVIEAPLGQIISFFCNLLITIIIVFGLTRIWNININAGELYIFITYIKQLFEPIIRTSENIEDAQDAVVSLNKIYDLIEQEDLLEDYDSGIELKGVKGKLEFKNVWFKYNDSDEKWVLKNISFVIEPTETIALVGKTGSGKTTITNLVNRFYKIQKGEILIDGININDINLNSLRKHIGNVLQDPFIFSGNIKDNIKLYKELTDEEVNEAIDLASARDFVDSLPNGIYTKTVERGENFSVGQKQLIAFARIFALNPDIFILDEATANMDTETEKLIQKSINKLSKEKTAIFIAHRLSTIVNVDKILVLKDGEIIEQGKHSELLNLNGYYANLYNSYYESLK